MRNLKRALSLGLTATMISGLMVMGSSAASYADVTSEQNQEAIEVLKAVDIMVGDEKGNFNPEAKVTRNEMAVVMSNLMAYNVKTYANTSPFTDVPDWAEPYVAACYTNGITSGYDKVTYGGSDNVTTAQAALMVMKALGYFQYQSDFGADWQLSTVAQGNKIDLFDDVETAVKDAINRNELAQLVLNALEAGTVEAEKNGQDITAGDITITSNVTYKYVTSGKDYATAINDKLATYTDGTHSSGAIVELGEKLYNGDLTKEDGYDDFGRPASVWEYQAKEVGTYADKADTVFTAKVTSKKLYDAVGKTATDNYDWTVSVNGEEVKYTGKNLASNKTDDDADFIYKALGDDKITGNGVVTEVFVDGTDKTVDVAVINYYAAEVYEVKKDDGTITLSSFYGPADTNDEFDATDFEEDEIVMYSFANNEIQEVYAAEKLEGDVTRVRSNATGTEELNGDNFVVDGTTYKYNATMAAGDRLKTENVNNNVVAYLDANGYVAYIDESAMTYDYAYVLSMGSSNDDFGGGNSGKTVKARLVLTDGTLIKVETDVKYEDISKYENHIVSYSKDKNDEYTLTVKDQDKTDVSQGTNGIKTAADKTALNIENGVASFTAAGDSYTANKNTVFVVADSDDKLDDYDFTVYTGVKNVPDIEGKTGAKVDVAADKDGVAKVVYVQDADVSGAGTVYFAHADKDAKLVKDSEVGNYFEIDAVVNNEVVTLKVKEGSTAADRLIENIGSYGVKLSNTERIIALDSITENADGLVTSVSRYDAMSDGDGFITGTGTGKAENETVKLNSANKRFAWDDEVVVVRYDYKGDFSTSRISSIKDDGNDDYVAVLDSNVITGICIVEKDGGEGQGSETITEGNVSYTTTISDRGNAKIEFKVERPSYVPADSTVTITGDLYLNGKDDNVTINETVPANKDTVKWTGTGYAADDKLEVKNLTVSYEKVTVKYVNGDTDKNIAYDDAIFASAPTKDLGIGTAGNVAFTLKTNTTTTPDLEYTVTGLAAGNVTTKTDLPANNNAAQTVVGSQKAKGDNFVTVTIYGLSQLDANETYTIDMTTKLADTKEDAISTSSPTGVTMDKVGVDGATNDTLKITVAKATGIKKGESVKFSAELGAGAQDNTSYNVTVKTTAGDLVFPDVKDTTKVDVYLKSISGNVEITDIVATAPAHLAVEKATVSTDGYEMTLVFNQAVKSSVSASDFTVSAGNIVGVSASDKTVTLRFDTTLADQTTVAAKVSVAEADTKLDANKDTVTVTLTDKYSTAIG